MDQQKAQQLYEEGLVLKKHKHYADALSCFEQVVELNANHAEAWFRIGCCHSELLEQKIENSEEVLGVQEESEIYEAAIQACQKAIELRPNHADAQESLSELFCNYFDLQGSAMEAYQKAIELRPNHADAHKALAELFYVYAQQQTENPSGGAGELYNYKRAIDWCKQASKICPEMIDECYQRMVWVYTCWIDDAGYSMRECIPGGIDEFGATMCEAADGLVETYQKLTRIRPDDFNAYYELGNAHRTGMNLYIEFDEHLGISSNYEIEEMKQGTHPSVRESLEKAIKAYSAAVKIKPDYADAYSALGKVYHQLCQFEEAIQAFKQAIVLDNKGCNDLARAYHQLGKQHFADGNYMRAIECYNNAIVTAFRGDRNEMYYDLAVAYHDTERYKLAIWAYRRVRSAYNYPSELFRRYPDLVYRLGTACHKCGHYQDAVDAYQEAIDYQTAIEEEYYQIDLGNSKKEYHKITSSEPFEYPEWWEDVYQNLESASRNEPL